MAGLEDRGGRVSAWRRGHPRGGADTFRMGLHLAIIGVDVVYSAAVEAGRLRVRAIDEEDDEEGADGLSHHVPRCDAIVFWKRAQTEACRAKPKNASRKPPRRRMGRNPGPVGKLSRKRPLKTKGEGT